MINELTVKTKSNYITVIPASKYKYFQLSLKNWVHSLLHGVRNLQTYQERKATGAAELQNKIQSKYSLKYRLKTLKGYKSLQKTSPVYRLY